MNERGGWWRITWALFTLANAAGAGWALARSEMPHASTHVGLMLFGAFLFWTTERRSLREEMKSVPPSDERLARLQQSVDAVALEVERIGEAQRFSAKQQVERNELPRG